MNYFFSALICICTVLGAASTWASPKVIISTTTDTCLPESSLPAFTFSATQGSKVIHLGVAMSADEQVMVLQHARLNDTTNVAAVFPDRVREDDSYVALDFTQTELQQLAFSPVRCSGIESVKSTNLSNLQLHPVTLAGTLSLFQRLEQMLGRTITPMVEFRETWLQAKAVDDFISTTLLQLQALSYGTPEHPVLIAAYNPNVLKRVHDKLLETQDMSATLIQLVDGNDGSEARAFEQGTWRPYNYDWLHTKFGIKAVSAFADAIAFPADTLLNKNGTLVNTPFLEDIHILGMQVFVYPFDQLLEEIPHSFKTSEELWHFIFSQDSFDGVITSRDRSARTILQQKIAKESQTISKQQQFINRLIKNAQQRETSGNSVP